jgi:ubiquinone/menaquinone biosynthesis C-methylase UbiE
VRTLTINFHDEENKNSYTTRVADQTWIKSIENIVNIEGKEILDIGGGGGIYSIALAQMGAVSVTCMDFSTQMVEAAQKNTTNYSEIKVVKGNALEIPISSSKVDIILERALIHHINEEGLVQCFTEAKRVLRSGGLLIIQDRTPQDCLVEGSETHLRG